MLSLPVAHLVELNICSFTEELKVEGFLLSDDDGGLEVHVHDGEQLVVTRLEEKVLDVAQQDISEAIQHSVE